MRIAFKRFSRHGLSITTGLPDCMYLEVLSNRIIHFSTNLLSYGRYWKEATRIVTEVEDRKQEKEQIRTAIHTCGYPDWAIKKVKEQMNRKKAIRKDKAKKDNAQEKSRGVVTVPYVHSFTEKIQCIFIKHRVATVIKPQTTLRQVLVHPNDKVEKHKKAGAVYKIPCSQCEKVCISETGRQPGTRITEQTKEAQKISDKFHKNHPQRFY